MKYKKEAILLLALLVASVISFIYIKNRFYSSLNLDASAKRIVKNLKNEKEIGYNNEVKYKQAVTALVEETTTYKNITTSLTTNEDKELVVKDDNIEEYPYVVAPSFEDDGSIIYEGMTLTELTDKLNRSLTGYLTNTGYFFADYTKKTGLDPYLSVSIVLLETGCKWSCSKLAKECNNIGGLKGGESCNGKSYRKYNTLGEGIDGFLDVIYNNYYLKGMKTPEQMSSSYAASSLWSAKVNQYISEIKAK